MKLGVRGIIFDLDGTIVDSKEAYWEAAGSTFSAFGFSTFDPQIVTEIPKRFELNLPFDDLISGVDVTKFREIYLSAYYKATAMRTRPFTDVGATLDKLSKKAKLGLTTRRHVYKGEILKQLEGFDLAKYFGAVVTASETIKPKPSPEALIKCSRELRVETCECAAVGDSVMDIRAGRDAGMVTVAVLSGIFSHEELERENPDLILKNVRELPNFL